MYQLSIEENLTRILNTTKFTLPLNPNFGLSNKFIDKTLSNELMLELKDEIMEQIKLYEPRIEVNNIEIILNNSMLTLKITTQDKSIAIDIT